jgi:hypothetical protein
MSLQQVSGFDVTQRKILVSKAHTMVTSEQGLALTLTLQLFHQEFTHG